MLFIGLCTILSPTCKAQSQLADAVTNEGSAESPETTSMVAAQNFSKYYDLIYQIQVVSSESGSKSSIGSGFQITADGLIITNYHVVSTFVQNPSSHNLVYRSHLGESGNLKLLDFDVVNDLAVLKHDNPNPQYFNLSNRQPPKGQRVFALGNPHDYGVSLVQGRNNGMVEHSYNQQILFSGSLNGGMSGGPALDINGNVVGVNVASAGSQLSFLIPVDAVRALTEARREVSVEDYQKELTLQIKRWQKGRLEDLINRDWPVETFANESLFGEIRKDIQCWGSTNADVKERAVERISKQCNAGNSLYLSSKHNSGQLYFSFLATQSILLNASQFSQTLSTTMQANNRSNFDHSTNYRCKVEFLQPSDTDSEEGYTRVTACIRAFKKMAGLYDSLLYVEQNNNLRSVAKHLSVSAAEKAHIQALNKKFIEHVL